MNSDILSPLETRRYLLQIELPSVGMSGQEKIKQSNVLVVGAGSKGTTLMQCLVSSGIGKIGISDNSRVEEHVLPNQRLYGNSDLGKQKAIISKQKLKELNHLVEIELHNICLSENNISSICSEYDIIVDATDNLPAHYLICDASIQMNKPVVYGKILGPEAHVSVFNYQDSPTFRTLYPNKPLKDQKLSMKEVASHSIIAGIAGTIMANEVLKIILGLENTLSGKLLVLDIRDYSIEIKDIEKK